MNRAKRVISLLLSLVILFSINMEVVTFAEDSVLFSDDFNDIGNMSVIETHGKSKASNENGTFKVTVNKDEMDGKVLATCGDINWLDYTLETRVKIDGNNPTDQFDVHFRYNREGRSYMIGWMRGKKSFFLLKDAPTWTGWAFDNLFFPEPEGFDPAVWNDIKIIVSGATIKLYVNGEFVFEYTDKQNVCYWGKVGLGAETRDDDELHCWFDNIKVTGTIREVEQNPFTGFFVESATLLKDNNFYNENWDIGKGFTVQESEYGRYLSLNGTGDATLKNIVFDNCALDMYLTLLSGELSAKLRVEADNLYYKVSINASNGGSVKISKVVNNMQTVIAETDNILEKYGVDLAKQNLFRIRALDDNIGLFVNVEKTPILVSKDEGTGIKQGKFIFSVNNAVGSICDVNVFRANTCVVPPAVQPVQPVKKIDMNDNDETAPVYKTIYVSPNGNDNNNGVNKDSPFRTLEKALEYVKTINDSMTGNIVISLADGEYVQNKTLKIKPEMSGKNGYYVIFKAEGKKADIISGAEVKNWENVDGKIYRAKLSEGMVHKGFKEFYLNGLRKERARQWITNISDLAFWDDPNTSYAPDGIYLSKSYLPKMVTTKGMELYHNKSFITYNHFVDEMIEDPENETRYILKMRQPFFKNTITSTLSIASELYSFKLQNAMEFLDESGEWFYNEADKYLYYYAEPVDDMNTAIGRVPGVDRIVEIEGTVDEYVSNIKFDGINFAYSGWEYANLHPYQDRQTPLIKITEEDSFSEQSSERMFNVIFADNLKFTNNTFQHTASVGLMFENGVDKVTLTGNIFNDIGSCGLVVGVASAEWDYMGDRSDRLPYAQHWEPNDEDRACSQIFVADNIFNDTGAGYNSGVAIAAPYVDTMYILHNDILNSSQNATTVGWGFDINGIASLQKICIMYNKLVDWNICEEFNDIGCMYSVGAIMGYNVSENYMSGDTVSGEKAIYLDNGSSYSYVSENVNENHHLDTTNIYSYGDHDNMIVQNFALLQNGSYNNGFDTVVEPVISYKLDNIPTRVKQIMKNAGLESEYAYLYEKYDDVIIDRRKMYPSYKLDAYKNGSGIAVRHDKRVKMSMLDNAQAEIIDGELYLPGFEAEEITLKRKGLYYGLSVIGNPNNELAVMSFNNDDTSNMLIKAKQGEKIWNVDGADIAVDYPIYYKNGIIMVPMKQLFKVLGIVDRHFVYDAQEDIMLVCDRLADVHPDKERTFMNYLSEKFQ